MSGNEIDIYISHLLHCYKTLGDSRYLIMYYIVLAIYKNNNASRFAFESYLICLKNAILSSDWNSYDEDKIENKNDLLQWVKENLIGKLITIKRRK